MDVSTARNSAVFYSGLGNRALAESFAAANGRTTLEMTRGGSWLDAQKLSVPKVPLRVSRLSLPLLTKKLPYGESNGSSDQSENFSPLVLLHEFSDGLASSSNPLATIVTQIDWKAHRTFLAFRWSRMPSGEKAGGFRDADPYRSITLNFGAFVSIHDGNDVQIFFPNGRG